jgi:hypothetical protein
MKDKPFIESIVKRGREAKAKASGGLSNISFEQLNWKPSPGSWSIAECLEHLLISDRSYFDNLKEIVVGKYKMTFWEQYSPFATLCGRLLKDRLRETVKKKMKAPKKIRPLPSAKPVAFIDIYFENLECFLNYISKCADIDIDKTIITSPTIKIVTYSLRDAFEFLIQHEHRHINQAIRVKENHEFPKTV